MTKLHLDVELYLDFPINQEDPDELAWFRDEVLAADPAGPGSLRLHSAEIGDSLGPVRVVSWRTEDRECVYDRAGAQAGLTVDQLIERVREWVIGNCDEGEGYYTDSDFEEGLRWVFDNEFGDYLLPRDTAPAEFDPAGFLTLLHRHVYPERDESLFEVPPHSTHYALRHFADGPAIDFWRRQTAADLDTLRPPLEADAPAWGQRASVSICGWCPDPHHPSPLYHPDGGPEHREPGQEARSAPAGGPDPAGASPEAGREEGGWESGPAGSTDNGPSWAEVVEEMDQRNAEREEEFTRSLRKAGFRVANTSELEEGARISSAMANAGFTGNRFGDPGFGRDAGSPLTKEWPDQDGEKQVWVRLPEGAKIYGAQPGDRFLSLSPDEAVVLFDILRHIGGDPLLSPRRHASSLAHKLWELVGTDPRPAGMPLPKDPSPEGVTGPCLYYLDDLPPVRIYGKEPSGSEEKPALPTAYEELRSMIDEMGKTVAHLERRLAHVESETAPF